MAFDDRIDDGPVVVLVGFGVGNQEVVGFPFDAENGLGQTGRVIVVDETEGAGRVVGDLAEIGGRSTPKEDPIVGGNVLKKKRFNLVNLLFLLQRN